MKPFALDNVLTYRKRLEDQARNRFIEAQKIHRQIEEKLAEENKVLDHLISCSERLQTEGVIITELIRYEERILKVKTNVRAISKTLTEKAEGVLREHRNLLSRVKERQVMEKLKTRQNKAWSEYLDKKETTMLDEIAILRHESEGL